MTSYVFHCENALNNKYLLRKAYNALKEGGNVLINDYPISESGTTPTGSALFAVNMFVSTERGELFSQEEIKSLLSETNFKGITTINPFLTVGYKK